MYLKTGDLSKVYNEPVIQKFICHFALNFLIFTGYDKDLLALQLKKFRKRHIVIFRPYCRYKGTSQNKNGFDHIVLIDANHCIRVLLQHNDLTESVLRSG